MLPASRRTRKAWLTVSGIKEREEARRRRRQAYCGDCDHGDSVGVKGGVPVGGAAEHNGLELGDACGGVDILDGDEVSIGRQDMESRGIDLDAQFDEGHQRHCSCLVRC